MEFSKGKRLAESNTFGEETHTGEIIIWKSDNKSTQSTTKTTAG